jgi:hypothetical protein
LVRGAERFLRRISTAFTSSVVLPFVMLHAGFFSAVRYLPDTL